MQGEHANDRVKRLEADWKRIDTFGIRERIDSAVELHVPIGRQTREIDTSHEHDRPVLIGLEDVDCGSPCTDSLLITFDTASKIVADCVMIALPALFNETTVYSMTASCKLCRMSPLLDGYRFVGKTESDGHIKKSISISSCKQQCQHRDRNC